MYSYGMKMDIRPLDKDSMERAKKRWDSIAKPINSLGKLEDSIIRMAGIFQSDRIDISKHCTVVMCADNGIVAEGVTQAGQDITAIMAKSMTQGKATINVLSKECGGDVFVVDVGIAADLEDCNGIISKKIMYGTKSFLKEPAMGIEEVQRAINVGIEMVESLKNQGYCMIATGEMGIGNTSTSSAVTACLLNKSPETVTGKGAGLTSSGLEHKTAVIKEALKLHQPDPKNPIDVLSKVGGLDIAAMAGVFIGGAIHRIPILVDGFISSAAALVAVRLDERVKDFIFATHISNEPAGRMVIEALELSHLLDLKMCLGEGTGAVIGFKIFDMAAAVYNSMSCFDDLNIESYKPLP